MAFPNLEQFPSSSGTYLLIMHLIKNSQLNIGKRGHAKFNSGYYLYVGSAFGSGGLRARLHHHLSSSAPPRWHVDYFKHLAKIEEVWYAITPFKREHEWANFINGLPEFTIALRGFGSSDCKCPTHLFYNRTYPQFLPFQQLLQKQYPEDPPLIRYLIEE